MKPPQPHSTDRYGDCQQAMSDRLFSLLNETTKAGWSQSEVALAAHELARAWLSGRNKQRATEVRTEGARPLRRQSDDAA